MADRRLLIWTLASFHAAGFTLGFVLPAYVSGGLSDVLPEFGTVPGFLGYGYIWVLSYLATRWVLTEEVSEDVFEETPAGSLKSVLLRGSAAGGLVGMATLLGPLLLVAVPASVTGGNLTALAFITAVGSGVAVVVGAAIGLVFTLLDVAAVRIAGRVAPEETESPPVESELVGETD